MEHPARGTYWSAQNPKWPPLPYTPFPDLPVYALGDRTFIYDDREVDYEKLRAEARAMEATSQPAVEEGGIMSPQMQGLLSVGITYDPPSGFFLDVFNMTPGVFYGIGAKDSLDADPFNTWSLASVFQAQAPDERLSGTLSAQMRYFVAVNLDEYVGPSVSILSPGSGSSVGGDLPLQIAVRDILPLLTVDVYVGGTQVGEILPEQNGILRLPTYWFPNGQHEIWVRVVNQGVPVDTDGDSVADEIATFQGWGNVTVNFANDVYMLNYSPLYSAVGSITLEYFATSPQDYTFEVFRLNGELLHTQNGLSLNGTMNPQWNFTDLAGQPVNDAGYVFSLTANPHAGGAAPAAAGKTIRTTNFVDKGVTVGKYVISYGESPTQAFNDWYTAMNDAVSFRANFAAILDEDVIGPTREAHGIMHADFTSDPYAIRRTTQTSDLTALTNALADTLTGSWLFEGHSGPADIIPGLDGHLTVRLTAQNLAALLGNRFTTPVATNLMYTRRFFSTFITGCSAANSYWAIATGTPPGVKQEGNPWIKKSAFLGFTYLSQIDTAGTKVRWINEIHAFWIDGDLYDTPLKTGVDLANLDFPTVLPWGPTLSGYRFLHYNAEGSR